MRCAIQRNPRPRWLSAQTGAPPPSLKRCAPKLDAVAEVATLVADRGTLNKGSHAVGVTSVRQPSLQVFFLLSKLHPRSRFGFRMMGQLHGSPTALEKNRLRLSWVGLGWVGPVVINPQPSLHPRVINPCPLNVPSIQRIGYLRFMCFGQNVSHILGPVWISLILR